MWGIDVILPRGVTGFGHLDEATSPVDMSAFRAHCFTAARLLGGRVRSVQAPSDRLYRSYALAILDLPRASVAVLLNIFRPIMAFAEPPAGGDVVHHFVECPELAELFRGLASYEILGPTELNEPVTSERCGELDPEERKQVKYFRPTRVGDVMFNYWD